MTKLTRADWKDLKARFLGSLRPLDIELTLDGERWARDRSGRWVAVLGAAFNRNRRWWLALDPDEFERRRALGVILLCRSEAGESLPFGLSRSFVTGLLPDLSRDVRGECKLNVVPRGDRYVLQLPGQDGVDLTASFEDFSWLWQSTAADGTDQELAGRREVQAVAETASERYGGDSAATSERASPSVPREGYEFFARVVDGRLEPVDPVPMVDGEFVVVRAFRVEGVPKNRALRRIIARGGPEGLPSDLAERHDEYARARLSQ